MKRILYSAVFILLALPSYSQNCPTINTSVSSYDVAEGDTVVFLATMKPLIASATYNWAISIGKIISGQGTSMIKVTTDSLGEMSLTATVEIGGIPSNCNRSSSVSVVVFDGPEKIISENYTTPQALAAAIKKFLEQVNLTNTFTSSSAFVYVYSGPATTAKQIEDMKLAIGKEFQKQGVFEFQYEFAEGGKKKAPAFEIFRLPVGGRRPKASK